MNLVQQLRGLWMTYADNPTARREYRSQLRGKKLFLAWSFYVGMLILIAGIAYSTSIRSSEMTIAGMQSALIGFYSAMVAVLGGLICLIVPSLTATTIVQERQNQSLDLVRVAPTELHRVLIGKMFASMRYVWILLAMALPVLVVGVAMGGALWTDVLATFITLSCIAMVLAAMGLVSSTTMAREQAALGNAYSFAILYALVTVIVGALGMSFAFGPGASTRSAPWFMCLSPFLLSWSVTTTTPIFGHDIPNWILASAFCLLTARVLVLMTASNLSHYDARATKLYRATLVGYALLFGAFIVGPVTLMFGMTIGRAMSSGAGPVGTPSIDVMRWLVVAVSLTVIVFAGGSDYGRLGERRQRPDGWWSWGGMWRSTPSGALPYHWLVLTMLVVGSVLPSLVAGVPVAWGMLLAVLAWSMSLFAMAWGMCRRICAVTWNARSGQSLVVLFLMLWLMVFPVLTSITMGAYQLDKSIYVITPFGFLIDSGYWPLIYGWTALYGILAVLFERSARAELTRPPRLVK